MSDNRNNRMLCERDVSTIMERYDVKYTCLDSAVYRRAMRHHSMMVDTNERLEFLGDAVVALIVSEYCHMRFADQDEAFLTRLRMQLVSGETLGRLSVEVGLPSWVVLPLKNEAARSRVNVQEDAMEAFVGATFTDQGYESARAWFVAVMEAHLDIADYVRRLYCSKDRLMTYCRAKWGELPTVVIDDAGEDNIFNAKVYHGGMLLAEAMGSTRRAAEVEACLSAWSIVTTKEAS
jgi:ribonuclease-3